MYTQQKKEAILTCQELGVILQICAYKHKIH